MRKDYVMGPTGQLREQFSENTSLRAKKLDLGGLWYDC